MRKVDSICLSRTLLCRVLTVLMPKMQTWGWASVVLSPEEVILSLSWCGVEVVVGVGWAGLDVQVLQMPHYQLRPCVSPCAREEEQKRAGGQRESDAWAYRYVCHGSRAGQGHTS